jgi:hypothetical protein
MLYNEIYSEEKKINGVYYINSVVFRDKFKKLLNDNILKALQKYKSSVKTRVVHKFVKNDNINFAFFSGSFKDTLTHIHSSNNKREIYYVLLNVNNENSFINNIALEGLFSALDTQKEIDQENSKITEYQIKNLEKLNKKYDEYFNKFLSNIDYFNLIDEIYFEYINFLCSKIFLNKPKETNKILELNASIISEIIKKIYLKSTKKYLNKEQETLVDLISDYFILQYYKDDSTMVATKKIEKMYDKNFTDVFKKISKLKIESLLDLNRFLTEMDVCKISDSLFKTYTRNFIGESGLKLLNNTKANFDAFLCSINHKNTLFNLSAFLSERKLKKLEDIILVEQGNTIIKDQSKNNDHSK